jgi:hypothetical protein
LLQAVTRFIGAASDDEARELLAAEPILMTAEAGEIVAQNVAAAQADTRLPDELKARLRARGDLWRAEKHKRLAGPLRPVAPADPQPWREMETASHQAVDSSEGRFVVVNAVNSAIGPNALVINQVGRIPLRWKRPDEIRPDLARRAVGRADELADLHRRLTTGQDAAIVSKGTAPARGNAAAVRGQPAIGKTTLAAMYAAGFGHLYTGGVLWLDVKYDRRSVESVEPLVRRLATYAYEADKQAEDMLQNCRFAPETVRALLSGHGPLLVIIDDVWEEAVLRYIKSALPAEASILLTTRDYKVAFALEDSSATILSLDVLNPGDARRLLQDKAPGLTAALADEVAAGLGRHALALRLAAGALAQRGPGRYEETGREILAAVRAGRGFGDLPRMDHRDRLSEVEKVLAYSYHYLAATSRGPALAAHFRALGAFAPEGSFDSAAAGALWDIADEREIEDTLLLFSGLGLLEEIHPPGARKVRWQQHAILRAYALSLQETAEQATLPVRHADYYLNLARRAYEAQPRDTDRLEREFTRIAHAFDWCEQESPGRAVRLVNLLNDFMRNRGRAGLLGRWLRRAATGAEVMADRLGTANTLQSLGDLESRLGNVDLARGHYDAALPLYEAEQDPWARPTRSRVWATWKAGSATSTWPAATTTPPCRCTRPSKPAWARPTRSRVWATWKAGSATSTWPAATTTPPCRCTRPSKPAWARPTRSRVWATWKEGSATSTWPAATTTPPCRCTRPSKPAWARPTRSRVWATWKAGSATSTWPAATTTPPCRCTRMSKTAWARPTRSRVWATWKEGSATSTWPAATTTPPCRCTRPSKPAWARPTRSRVWATWKAGSATSTWPAATTTPPCRCTRMSKTAWARPTRSRVWATWKEGSATSTWPAATTTPPCRCTRPSKPAWARPTRSRVWATWKAGSATSTWPAATTTPPCRCTRPSKTPLAR